MKKQIWMFGTALAGIFFLAQILMAQSLLAQNQPAHAADPPAANGSQPAAKAKTPDRAAAYYHFVMAHMYEEQYEEQVATYGRSAAADKTAEKATEEYRAAIDADPTSAFLTSGLAELYAKTDLISDAVA